MAKKEIKKCGWCGEEIKENEDILRFGKDKLIMIFCNKCHFEREDLDKHLRKMLA